MFWYFCILALRIIMYLCVAKLSDLYLLLKTYKMIHFQRKIIFNFGLSMENKQLYMLITSSASVTKCNPCTKNFICTNKVTIHFVVWGCYHVSNRINRVKMTSELQTTLDEYCSPHAKVSCQAGLDDIPLIFASLLECLLKPFHQNAIWVESPA